jgi:hypothetical protein
MNLKRMLNETWESWKDILLLCCSLWLFTRGGREEEVGGVGDNMPERKKDRQKEIKRGKKEREIPFDRMRVCVGK